MTTDLEKQFFDTFGIKPKYYYKCKIQDKLVPEDEFILSYCSQSEVIGFCTDKEYYNSCRVIKTYKEYPQITDRILLELICIKNKELISIVQVKGKNLEELKNYILQMCIKGYTKYSNSSLSAYRELADNFKHQVRTLFEEGR